jgi:hypothetical protein
MVSAQKMKGKYEVDMFFHGFQVVPSCPGVAKCSQGAAM